MISRFPEYSGFSSGKRVMGQDAVDQISGWEQPWVVRTSIAATRSQVECSFEQAEKGRNSRGLSRDSGRDGSAGSRHAAVCKSQGIGEGTGFVTRTFQDNGDVQ